MICRVCDSPRLVPAIDLGVQPWANHFLTPAQVGHEPVYPLRVVFCEECATAQLDYTVAKETMFSDHTYLSGMTKTLSDHFRGVADAVNRRFFADRPRKAMLDIGSNDGTQLRHYRELGFDILGVEPARLPAQLANDAGLTTLRAFFNADTARTLDRKFEVINASGVFFHLEELHSVTAGIRAALADDGVFVLQFLYMKRIAENDAFDQIYHEHLLYYNVATLERLLRRHGLALFDAEFSPIHGGSIIAYATHAAHAEPSAHLRAMLAAEERDGANTLAWYQAFAGRIARRKEESLAYLRARRAEGKTVFGLGAPVKGNTLLNTFGIGPGLISCLVEKNPHRRGLVAPGSHIPLLLEDELPAPPDVYFVLAWNFKKEILARHADLVARGVEFYFPVNPRESE
ncbi:MAG: class I SAM-dependent methyltransferase [Opitutae bacterium]|nr:class I SAM-dependent methyltransferase [Opitutae bacterium]